MKKGKSRVDCVRNNIREYLIEQCKEDIPATFADFCSKHPDISITNNSFKLNVHQLKKN